MARKVNINTFNPQAGVSIPGWATESYKQTIDTLSDVASDVTGEIKQGRKDSMAFALESARIKQREKEFDYKKELDDFKIAKDNFESATNELTGSSIDNDVYDLLLKSVPATSNPRLTEYYESKREIHKKRVLERNNVRENLRETFLNGLPDEDLSKDGLDVTLDSWTMQYFKDPNGWNKNMTEHTFKQMYSDYNPDFLTKEKTKAVLGSLGLNVLPSLVTADRNTKEGRKKYDKALSQWNAGMDLLGKEPGSGTNFAMTGSIDSKYASDAGLTSSEISKRRSEDPGGLDAEINNFYAGDDEKDKGFLEGLGDFISDAFSQPAGDFATDTGESISESGVGTIARFLNREDTDLTQELDKVVGILGGLPAEGWQGIKSGAPALAEFTIESFKELPDIAQKTYSEFASNHPNISAGLGAAGFTSGALNPLLGTIAYSQASPEQKDKVKQFAIDSYNRAEPVIKDMTYLALDKADSAMMSGLEYATEKFTSGIKAVHGARAPKMALRRGMEVMSTLPHRAIEFFNFNRNPDIDKYVEGGMSYDDAYDQAMKDAVARGGEYYTRSAWRTGEDAPSKHIYKKTLVDYASNKNLWMLERGPFKKGGSDMPENMKNAPAKFINPRWIAWKTNNLEKDLYAQYAKITDAKNQAPALAAKSMMNVKNKSSKLIKDLRKIKSDIVSAPKISKGELTVSPKVIDELINKAQRLTASKSALNAWDNFMKKPDLEKEIGLEADDIAKEFEFEALLDSLQGAPSRFDFETYQYPFPIYKSDN